MNRPQPDIDIQGAVGFYRIAAPTEAGHEWAQANIDHYDAQSRTVYTDGGAYACAIADGAVAAGRRVEVNGREYLGRVAS